ncbi:hypothetical protein NFF90_11520 [Proteus mirabilis]|nr:hypothetical protein [Proteus mirabilis]MDF7133814.1 hypothetical protein [Proteus mirabilis]
MSGCSSTCWGNDPHIPWSSISRESYALFTSASKSFNIPALTGAYGIINDSRSRYAFHGCCTKNYQSTPSLVP